MPSTGNTDNMIPAELQTASGIAARLTDRSVSSMEHRSGMDVDVVGNVGEGGLNVLRVGEEIAMALHHTFG